MDIIVPAGPPPRLPATVRHYIGQLMRELNAAPSLLIAHRIVYTDTRGLYTGKDLGREAVLLSRD